MYTQDRFSKIKKRKSKKAVSEIIGYVLLVSFAIIISIIVYKWMKTYVPQEDVNCPSGVSLFIDSYTLNGDTLTLNLRNNGKFDIGGYFIYATNNASQELATVDLSGMNVDPNSRLAPLGVKFGSYISGNQNSLAPNGVETDSYNLTSINGKIYAVEILPIRWQTENRKMTLVSCQDAKIREEVVAENGGGSGPTDTCDGSWNPPESSGIECDGGTFCFANCTCQGAYEPDTLGGCRIPTSVQSCSDYCIWLGNPVYISGTCRASSNSCNTRGETHQSGGDTWCTGGGNADTCCCHP